MEPGKIRARHECVVVFALMWLLLAGGGAWAQQQSPPATQNATPSLPPLQSVEQAAAGASAKSSDGATKPAQDAQSTNSAAPDTTDSGTIRVSAGDLIEVNVYNVPELTSKA